MDAAPALILLGLGVGAWAVIRGARRHLELFRVEVRAGRLVAVGRAPTALVDDLADALRRDRITEASFRVVADGDRPRVADAQGLPEPTAQVVRNLVGTWPLARLRAAPVRR